MIALSMCILQSPWSSQKFWIANYKFHKDYKRYQNNRITQFEQSRLKNQKFWKCRGFNKFKMWGFYHMGNVAFWTCRTMPLVTFFRYFKENLSFCLGKNSGIHQFFGGNQSFIIPHQVQFWFWCPICHPNPLGFQIHL